MDIGKILNQSTTDYQVSMARLVLSYSRADEATQKQLLESYIAIIKEYEDAREDDKSDERDLSELDEDQLDEMWAKEDDLERDDDELGIDEIMDDPRYGQAEPLNRGDF
jgi:hypothetical protein